MNIFIPAVKDANPFFDGIEMYSKYTFSYGSLNDFNFKDSLVLIHWPEQLFNWVEPTDKQLLHLKTKIKLWKKHTKLVYTVHNLKRHYGMTPNFKKLYDLILNSCDAMVHLGQYSLKLLQKKYPLKIHKYIPHPLYIEPFTQYNKIEAREKLGISNRKKLIVVPGNIRLLQERKMIINAFKALKVNNKTLAVPNMFKKELKIDFKGRYWLKKYVDIKKLAEIIYNKDYFTSYKFDYGFTDFKKLSLWLSAADVIMIPRIDSLNSGNLFLGLTFKKVVVGPEIGNIKEFLEIFNLPKFCPKDQASISCALNKAVQISTCEIPYTENQLQNYKPENIALKWDDFLDKLI